MDKIIGYVRVSTDRQDADNQKHRILEYAQIKRLIVDEFIEVEVSSRKSTKERKIDELFEKLRAGDRLLITEISRLGRNMLEVLKIIEEINERNIQIEFINQPELSTTGGHSRLLLAIYSYFAEAEREFISQRTKQGLALTKARGTHLGRPKGGRNKHHPLDNYRDKIIKYLEMGLAVHAICKLINEEIKKKKQEPVSYQRYLHYVGRL